MFIYTFKTTSLVDYSKLSIKFSVPVCRFEYHVFKFLNVNTSVVVEQLFT